MATEAAEAGLIHIAHEKRLHAKFQPPSFKCYGAASMSYFIENFILCK